MNEKLLGKKIYSWVLALGLMLALFGLTSPAQAAYFSDNADGTAQMTTQGAWGKTNNQAYSGSYSWTDVGSYGTNVDISLTSAQFSLVGSTNPRLTFKHRYDFPSGDYGYVQISTNGGSTWSNLEGWLGGTNTSWTSKDYDLSPYKTSSTVKIRFRITSDNWSIGDGWYIDDILVEEQVPAVTLTNPANGATGTRVDRVSVTFNKESIDPATVNSSTFVVKDNATNTPVPGTYTVVGDTVTFKPDQNLVYSAVYNATVTTGIKGKNGYALPSDYNWSFTTASGDSTPPSGSLKINNDNSTVHVRDVALQITATDDISGVTQMRIANSLAELDASPLVPYAATYNWRLTSGSGSKTVYARVYDAEGYASSVLSDTITYDLNTTYYSDNSDTSPQPMNPGSPWGKDTSAYHSGPSSWADSPGVYTAANVNASYITYRLSNPDILSDSSSVPTNVITTPTIDLSQATSPKLSFWQRYNFDTNYGVVQVSKDGGNTWSRLTEVTGSKAVWTEQSIDLSNYKTSTVKIRFFVSTGYYSGNTDGWYLDDIRVGEDNPTVVSTNIANGAVNVPVSSSVIATFDTAINPATINLANLTVTDGSQPVAGSLSVNGNVVTFTPANNLAYSKSYTVTLTTGINSTLGAALENDYSWTFTTMPADTAKPINGITINNAANSTNSLYVTLNFSATDDNSGVKFIKLSNTSEGLNTAPLMPFNSTYTWRLTSGDGTKTVYSVVYDAAGNVSDVVYDSIEYDSFSIDPLNSWSITKRLTITGNVEPGSTVSVAVSPYGGSQAATVTGGTWSFTIADLTGGDNTITVTATKGASTKTKTVSITFNPYFSDYMEGSPKFSKYGDWGITTSSAYSGTKAWTDSPSGDYVSWTRSWIVSDEFKINVAQKPTLYFKYRSLFNTGEHGYAELRKVTYYSGKPSYSTQQTGDITATNANWTEYSMNLTAIDNDYKEIRFRFTSDGNNNADGWYIDNVVVAEASDLTAPVTNASSILINNNDISTGTSIVTLNLSAFDNTPAVNNVLPAAMQFSDDNINWTPWEEYATTKSWTLNWGSGSKTVYARFKDQSGNLSAVVSDTIDLDVTPPDLTLNSVPAAVYNNTYTISGTITDVNPVTVNIATDTFASDGMATVTGTAPNYTWSYNITTLAPGVNNVTITTTDDGGNFSTVTTAVYLDTTADNTKPVGSIVINNGVAQTNSTAVTLTLNPTDSGANDTGVNWMQFSNTNDFTNVDWILFNSTYNWTLPAGDVTKTVYARFMDATGNTITNVSDPASDTIYLDTTPPIINVGSFTSPINAFGQIITGTTADNLPVTISVASNTKNLAGAYATATVSGSAPNYTWSYTIPNDAVNGPAAGLIYGDNLYTFTVTDAAGNTSTTTATINSTYKYFWNDGTDLPGSDPNSMDPAGTTWGVTTADFVSGPASWTDSPSGNYGTTTGNTFFYTHSIDLSNSVVPYLTFSLKTNLSTGEYLYLHFWNGTSWVSPPYPITSYWSGNRAWTQYGYNIRAYKNANFKVRFQFYNNGDVNVGDGVFLDDIRIVEQEAYKPKITSVFPTEGATNVSYKLADYGANFSESMGGISETGPNLALKNLPANVQYLDYNTPYTVSINVAGSTDGWGNQLMAGKTWTFTTEPDTYPPTGTIVINKDPNNAGDTTGATRTNSQFVTLNLTAADVNYNTPVLTMRFSNDGTNWSSWEPYAGTRSLWRLADGDGIKTVYTQFKDAANNISFPPLLYKDTIELDLTQPSLTINAVNTPTNVNSQTITGSVFDINLSTVSIATDTAASDGNATVTNGTAPGGSWTYNITGLVAGSNLITITATDLAGNTNTVTSSIYLDTIKPTVTAITPANGTTGVALNTTVTANFSRAMDSSTINTATFKLKDSNNTPVSGTVSYSGNNATFTPSSSLAANTVYTATVTNSVKDTVSNYMASNYIWTFTTLDNVIPVVTGSDPVANAVYVPINKMITVTFSEKIQPGSNYSAITLTKNSDGTVVESTYSIKDNVLTIYPNIYLANNAVYTVTVPAGGVQDMVYNNLAVDLSFNFTTAGASPATTPFTGISAGANHNAALQGDGRPVTWGANEKGQLGDGTYNEGKTNPVMVRKDDGTPWFTDVQAVSAGKLHTAAIRTDGTVWSWGDNSYGEMGNGTVDTLPPYAKLTPVGSLSTVYNNVYTNGSPNPDTWVHTATTPADFSAGTVSNVVLTTAGDLELPGSGNNYLTFDGVNDGVNLSAGFTAPVNTFSYEFWVKPTATHEIDAESTSSTTGTAGQKYAIGPEWKNADGGAGVSVGTNGISVYEHGNGYMPPLLVYPTTINDWVHVAVVYNNKTPSLYVNGQLVRTGLTSQRPNVYPSLYFGQVGSNYFQGSLRDIRYWDYARTAAQIQQDMNAKLTGLETGLLGYWKLDEVSGTAVKDSKGTRNGSFVDAPVWSSNFAYAATGTYTSPEIDISAVGFAGTSTVSWNSATVNKTDAVPILTADNAPAPYVASTSFAQLNGSTSAYKAFDNNTSTVSHSQSGVTTGTFNMDFGAGNGKTITKYTLTPQSAVEWDRAPKNWTLEGSNNNSTWSVLDTRTNLTAWSGNPVAFTFTNTTSYRYYRLNVTANNGDSYLVLSEMELMEDLAPPTVETNVFYEGAWQGWQSVANGGAIAGLAVGTDLKNTKLQYKVSLATNDVKVTPQLNDLTVTMRPKFYARTDLVTNNWYNPNWRYRKAIKIDHAKVDTADLTNFPVLISGVAVNYAKSDGSDIRFTAADGVTELSREIESITNSTVTAWVKIPALSATVDTTVYMYYGNPNATEPAANSAYGKQSVWDSNFKMVQHMKDNTTSSITDSTVNANNGTKYSSNRPVQTTSGQIANAQSFDGLSDYVNAGNNASLNFNTSGSFTYSTWINQLSWEPTIGTWANYAATMGNPVNTEVGHGWYVRMYQNNGNKGIVQFLAGNNGSSYNYLGSTADSVNLNTWMHLTAEVDGNTMRLFINGVPAGTQNMAGKNLYDPTFFIGSYSSYASWGANAIMDEVRLSDSARSANWIKTEYNNQSNPSAFYSVGNMEDLYVPPTATSSVIDLSSAGASGGSQLTWDLVQPAATFSRASVGYRLDGSQVGINQPSFDVGKFGQGITVGEEALKFSFDMKKNLTDGNAYYSAEFKNVPDYTIQSGDYLEYDVHWPLNTASGLLQKYISIVFRINDWERVTWDGTFKDQNNLDASSWQDLYWPTNYASGKWYHRKIPLGSLAGKPITNFDMMSEWDYTGKLEAMFRRIVITDGAGNVRKNIWSPGDPLPEIGLDFQDATGGHSVTVSKVAADKLSLDLQLSPKAGTIEQWVNVSDLSKRTGVGLYSRTFMIYRAEGTQVGLYLGHNHNTSDWRVFVNNDAGTNYELLTPDSVTPNGWHHFAVTWSELGVKLYIDGVQRGSTIAASYLPTAFQNKVYIGWNPGYNDRFVNSTIDELRISSIARSDAEIYADYISNTPLAADYYTLRKYNFDDSLQQNSNDAIFARSTIGYKLDGTTQLAAEQPNFEPGKFGQGITVSEGAIDVSFNMVQAEDAYLDAEITNVRKGQITWPDPYYPVAGHYLEYDVLFPAIGPADKKIAVDITTNTGATLRSVSAADQNGVAADATGDLSPYAYGKWYHRKISLDSFVGQYISNYRISSEYDGGGTVNALIRNVVATDSSGNRKWTILYNYDEPAFTITRNSDSLQSMSFTRIAPENLSIGAGISTKQGTVEQWVYVNNMVRRQTGTNARVFQVLRTLDNGWGLLVYRHGMSTNWKFAARTDANTTSTIDVADAVVPDGWNHFAVTWGTSGAKLYINGAQQATIDAAYMPSAFLGVVNPGGHFNASGGAMLNSIIDDFRLSSIERTAAAVYADYSSNAPLPVDNFTIAKYNFDNDLKAVSTAQPEVATFLRPSVAYKLDGTQVTSANQPVFEAGKFGQAVQVGEGALYASYNMVASGNSYLYADMTSVTDYGPILAGSYLEYDLLLPADTPSGERMAVDFTTSDSVTLRDSGATDQNGVSAHPNIDLAAYASGQWYHRKIAIPAGLVGKTIANYDLVTYFNAGGTATGMFRRIVITDGAGAVRKNIWVDTDAAPTLATHITTGGAHTYAVTKVESESLSVPAALSPSQGTIEQWVYVSDTSKRYTGTAGRIFQLNRTDGYYAGMVLYHNTTTAEWKLLTRNNITPDAQYVNYDSTAVSDSVTPNGWHHFAVKWDGSGTKMFIDGVQQGSTISASYLPSAFTGTVYLGQHYNNAHYLNTMFDDLRVSSVARSDAEILASYTSNAPLSIDDKTMVKLDFDNNLRGYFKNVVETNLSLDNGVTWQGWQSASNSGAITGINVGTNLSQAKLQYRTQLPINGNWNLNLGIGNRTFAVVSSIEPTTAAAVYAGENYTFALKADGTVWAWGDNQYGQLGLGETTGVPEPSPIQVPGLTGITGIATGGYHVAALKDDGTVWTWGFNNSDPLYDAGQLGRPSTDLYTPTQVPGLTGVTAIAAGGLHTIALKSDGTVWTWGSGAYGQLGRTLTPEEEVTMSSTTPGQVEDPSDVSTYLQGIAAIDAGVFHTIALKNDGTVWTWGQNIQGQLGDGSVVIAQPAPTQVAGLTGVTAIAAGDYHNIALKSNGYIWSWGANDKGQLGDQTGGVVGDQRNSPVQTYYDLTPPVVVSTTPVLNAENIQRNANLTVTFDEPIDPLTITNDSFVVSDQVYGTVIPGTAKASGNTATFTPTGGYGLGTLHKVIFKPGVKDMVGNVTTGSYSWTFTTTPDITGPQCWVKINNDAASTNLKTVALTVSSDDNSGVVSSMQFSNDGITWSSWQTYTGPLPTKPIGTAVNWELSPGDGEKTVYVRFADPAGNTSLVYSDTIILHTAPPQVTGTNLANSQAMEVYDSLTFTFDEVVLPGSKYNYITVNKLDGTTVSINKSISADQKVLTLDPISDFSYNTGYYVVIPHNAIVDSYGNSLVQDVVYNFTVGPDTLGPTARAVPAGGQYTQATTLILEALNEPDPISIYYTTNGSEPLAGVSPLYNGPITITTYGTTVVKFKAVDGAGNSSATFTEQYTLDPTGPKSIAGSSTAPVIYDNKVVYTQNGIRFLNLTDGTEATVASSTYLYQLGDFDQVNGRVIYGYSSISGFNGIEKGLQIFDIANGQFIEGVDSPGAANFGSAIYGNLVLYYDISADATKVKNLTTGTETVIGTGAFSNKDLTDNYVVYSDAGGISIRDINSGNTRVLDPITNVAGLHFSADPNMVYWTENSQTVNGKVYLYDLTADTKTLIGEGNNPYIEGRSVYYDKGLEDGSKHIFSKNLDTGIETQLTTSNYFEQNTSPMYGSLVLVYKKDGNVMVRDFSLAPPEVMAVQPGNTYTGSVDVELEASKADTDIYYINDVDNPSPAESWIKYSAPISIKTNTKVNYFGIDSLGQKSKVSFQQYTIQPDTLAPEVTADPVGGTFVNGTTVTLTANEQATIYYTLDGSEVTTSSAVYSEPILVNGVNETKILKYLAVDAAGNQSGVVVQYYIINTPPPPPPPDTVAPYVYALPAGGNYNTTPIVISLNASETATIRYTVDGSTPTGSSTVYTEPIQITANTTLKFYGVDTAGNQSVVVTEGYTIEVIVPDVTAPVVNASVPGGTYTTAQTITLTANETATIHYTVDGSTPTGSSTVYTEPIQITANTTLKFYGVDTAGNQSGVVTEGYTIDVTAPVVNASVPGGTYNTAQTITLTASETATIRYTVDGSTPTGSSTVYTEPIQITANTTLKFYGVDTAGNQSGVVTEGYTIDVTAPEVNATVPGGTYNTTQTVTLTANEAATIRYTVDGSTPNSSSPVYSGPIQITANTTLKFYGVDTAGNQSVVVTESYTIDVTAPEVNATVPGGTYTSAQTVTLTANEPATIRYTTDGSTPTSASPLYSGPIQITANTTLKFYGVDTAGNQSVVVIESYTIDVTAPVVTASVPGGTYNTAQTVTLTANELATIRYTTDGSTPNGSSSVYTGPIPVNATTTLKFYGVDTAGNQSVVVTESYTIDVTPPDVTPPDVTAPTVNASASGGTYNTAQTITLAGNESVTIRYTVDGSTPNGSSPVYTGPITVNATTTLKFYGVDNAGNQSVVVTESYTIDVTAPTVNASVSGGTYNTAQTVTLTASESATIRYTIDGSTPNGTSTVYTGSISVTATTTLKYFAVDNVGNASPIVTQEYIINTGVSGGSTLGGTPPAEATGPVIMTTIDPVTSTQAAEVTAQGTTIATTGGEVTIAIPKDALQNTVKMTVTPVKQADIPATVVLLSNTVPVSQIYEFGPTGTTFAQPVSITLKIDQAALGSNDKVEPYYLNEQTGVWELIPKFTVDWNNGTLTFETSHFSKYALMAKKLQTFEDIRSHWAKDYIEEIAGKAIVSGKTAKLFAPDDKITRAEFAKILAGSLGLTPAAGGKTFADVDAKAWYYQWVEAAYRAGLVKGSNGKFRPNDKITREEMAVMIVNAAAARNKALEGDQAVLTPFGDKEKVSAWAKSGMLKAVKAGIVTGKSSKVLAPFDNATRAEAVVMIKRLLDLTK